MSLFWPHKANPTPNILTYVDRVLHWIGCAIALSTCLFGPAYFVYGIQIMIEGHPTGASLLMAFGIASFVAGMLVYFLSRAVRYLVSHE